VKKLTRIKGLPVVDTTGALLGHVCELRTREQAAGASSASEIAFLLYGYRGLLERLGLRRTTPHKLELSAVRITATKVVVQPPA
jgi:hypothetical protein